MSLYNVAFAVLLGLGVNVASASPPREAYLPAHRAPSTRPGLHFKPHQPWHLFPHSPRRQKVCYVPSHNDGATDDSDAILKALHQINSRISLASKHMAVPMASLAPPVLCPAMAWDSAHPAHPAHLHHILWAMVRHRARQASNRRRLRLVPFSLSNRCPLVHQLSKCISPRHNNRRHSSQRQARSSFPLAASKAHHILPQL